MSRILTLEHATTPQHFTAIAKAVELGNASGLAFRKYTEAGFKCNGAMAWADAFGYNVIKSPYDPKRRNILRRAFIAAFLQTVNA